MCITISQSECVVEAQLFFDYAKICILHQQNSNPNHLEFDNICVRFSLSPLVYLRVVFVLYFIEKSHSQRNVMLVKQELLSARSNSHMSCELVDYLWTTNFTNL